MALAAFSGLAVVDFPVHPFLISQDTLLSCFGSIRECVVLYDGLCGNGDEVVVRDREIDLCCLFLSITKHVGELRDSCGFSIV